MSDSLKDIIDKSSLLDDESEIRENEVRISGELLLDSEYAISINIIELDMCVGSIVFVSNGLVIKKLLFAKNIDIENICNENIDNIAINRRFKLKGFKNIGVDEYLCTLINY